MPKRVSYNKILESEFTIEELESKINKITEAELPEGYEIDIEPESSLSNCQCSLFKDNQEVAYGNIDVDTNKIVCEGSTFSQELNDKIKEQEYEDTNALIKDVDSVMNPKVEEDEPKSLDPLDIIKSADNQELLDSYAKEYLMDDEYDLYIESKPDASFEDNKNYVIYLLENDPYME